MSDAQIREWDSALTRCAALLVRSSYRDDISDEDADMLRDAVSRATRARDGLITRLRAAESERDDLRCEVEALQAERDTARVEAGRLRESLRVLTREHDALITRLRAAEARTAWQPIETAPRDCCVIGWADEWARPDVAWYCAGAWWSGCGSPCPEITHWQPLPAAPEAP